MKDLRGFKPTYKDLHITVNYGIRFHYHLPLSFTPFLFLSSIYILNYQLFILVTSVPFLSLSLPYNYVYRDSFLYSIRSEKDHLPNLIHHFTNSQSPSLMRITGSYQRHKTLPSFHFDLFLMHEIIQLVSIFASAKGN